MKKCKSCKTEFEPIKAIQPYCVSCTIARAKKSVKREKNAELRAMKQERITQAEKLKTISDYKRELQPLVNLIARLIDEGCPCISSGRLTGKFNGGHRFSTGAWDNLRFNLFNIWIQSFEQNHYKSGNPTGYDQSLINMGLFDYVHDLRVIYKDVKYDRAELKQAIVTARHIIKELGKLNENEKTPRSLERRIELRKIYNTLLNIYE